MIEFRNQELHVSGKIAFENAENYYLNGLRVIQNEQNFPMIVNLSQLEHGSTLALSVFVQRLSQTPST